MAIADPCFQLTWTLGDPGSMVEFFMFHRQSQADCEMGLHVVRRTRHRPLPPTHSGRYRVRCGVSFDNSSVSKKRECLSGCSLYLDNTKRICSQICSRECVLAVVVGHGLRRRSFPPTVEVISRRVVLPPRCSAVTRKPPCARSLEKLASLSFGQAGKTRMMLSTL